MTAAVVTMPMAAPTALRPLLATAALLLAMAAVAQGSTGREPEILNKEDYPALEETVVRGQKPPQWRETQEAPDFNREKFKFEPEVEQPRMQLMPKYTRDDRDNYDGVRDRMNQTPEIKLFQFKF